MKPYIKKYAPKSCSKIIGQGKAVARLKDFVLNFKKQKKKAMFLHGPTGSGKTSSVYAFADEYNLEVMELNASDLRNKDQINSVLSAACQQMSLFGGSKVILVDEVDGISGRHDRGGVPEIVKLIEKSSFPIILTANNPYDNKFSKLRRRAEMVEYSELSALDLFEILKNICIAENIGYEDSGIKMIARRAAGDARAAINDLQIISSVSAVTRKAAEDLSGRDKMDTMLNALVRVFKSTDPEIARGAFDNVSEDINEQMLWIDENLALEYKKPSDLARAYDKLSKADVYLGRIRRWQHWRFLVYAGSLISAGIAVSKDNKNPGFVKYKPTGRILKLWWAKQKSMKKKAIAEKIALLTHTSTRRVVQEIEFYKIMFKDKKIAEAITAECDLDKEEISWMNK
jgi:replication factor C large subunit